MPGPPRLPEQPIFYPALNEDYAIRIGRDWNGPHSGVGYVTRFEVDTEFLSWYPVQQAGGETILELWVPAEELDEFNADVVGTIRHGFGSRVAPPGPPENDTNTNRGLWRRVGTPRPDVRSPRW